MKTIAFDFDGVLATYNGWKGFDVLGKPNRNVINVLNKLYDKGYYIIIFTTRQFTPTMKKWLKDNDVKYHSYGRKDDPEFTNKIKPVYHAIVDDRAVNVNCNKGEINEENLINKIINVAENYQENSKSIGFTGDTSLFIGRWQPLHRGHIKLIRTVLNEGNKVCIGIRDSKVDDKNPYSVEERIDMICREFKREMNIGKLTYVVLPDIKEVVHGRKVGWGIREIRLDKETENISGTKIREEG